MSERRSKVVSVVLVNFRGPENTIEAIQQLQRIDWPEDLLEVIVVDNASGDSSVQMISDAAPQVTIVESQENLGFAGGCNLGVSVSVGEFVGFLNSDAKPDSSWIRGAIDAFDESPDIGAVASRVLDWEGKTVDFVDSALTWFGMGYKPFLGASAKTSGTTPRDVLFGTGAAMFVRRSVFDQLNGFDDRLFMFFEDVDLGWRLNLLGLRYRYQPTSIAYHRHHGSVSKFGSFRESYYLERNSLAILYKNLSQQKLDSALPAAMGLAVRRGTARGSIDSTAFDFRTEGGDDRTDMVVSKDALAPYFGIDQFVKELPGLAASRIHIQSTRNVSDAGIWHLFGEVDVVSYKNPLYLEGYENLVAAFPVTSDASLTRVLIITGDPIGVKMAGPAIRAFNIALALSAEHDVTLLTMSALEALEAPFVLGHIRAGDGRSFAPWERWADIIIFQGHALAVFPAIGESSKIVIADIYDPMHLEQLEQARELPYLTWTKQVADATQVLNDQLARADFLICASERQRLFYLGQLAAVGRINPATYQNDPDLRGLIDVVPFGLNEKPPIQTRSALKGVVEGIGSHDKVLLWSGGLYNWFDPITLIRAVAKISETHDDVRLFFQGTKHPHPGVPEMAVIGESRLLAKQLGVVDSSVFFNDAWVEYEDRQNYLLEADVGVSTHFSHIETTFSFRTRILDYLWAGVPMVVTDGDSFAEMVIAEKLGLVVPANDVESLVLALERVLFDEGFAQECRANIATARERFYWSRVLQPIVEFVRSPSRAADKAEPTPVSGISRAAKRRKPYGLRHDIGLVVHHLRNGGVRVVLSKLRSRINSR